MIQFNYIIYNQFSFIFFVPCVDLTKALDISQTENEKLKEDLRMLGEEKKQTDDEIAELKKTGVSLNEVKKEMKEQSKTTIEFVYQRQTEFNSNLQRKESEIGHLNDELRARNQTILHLKGILMLLLY